MESDRTISQWFAAIIEKERAQIDITVDAAEADTHWDDESLQALQDVLRVLLQDNISEEGHSLSESLASPSPTVLTQSAQIETNHLLANFLASVVESDGTLAPAMPYEQVADMGAGLAIYNAAFIPGWPAPVFAKNPEVAPDETEQHMRDEARIVAYLIEQGLNKDLLSKVLKSFKTASDRVGFLTWLSTLINVVTVTLETLRKEAADPVLSTEDPAGYANDSNLRQSKSRRFLKI